MPEMKFLKLFIIPLLFINPGCDSKSEGSFATSAPMDASASMPPNAGSSRDRAAESSSATPSDGSVQVTQPKLIKEGELRIETSDVIRLRKTLLDEVAKVNGYTEQDEGNTYDGRTEHTLLLRIPAGQYDAFLKLVSETGGRIEHKNIRIRDVTEEFIDIQARLNTKKALEARYLQLLQQASRIEDILKIEKELAEQRSEIESIEGRLNFLSKKVAFSTLRITFYQTTPYKYPFFNRIGDALTEGWNIFLGFIVMLFRLWPFMLGLVFVWLLIRWWRRRKS